MKTMNHTQTVPVPMGVIQKLHELLNELEEAASPYKPAFLARMYRARANDLEGKGKSLATIKQRFQKI
jgi:hypothetical protein